MSLPSTAPADPRGTAPHPTTASGTRTSDARRRQRVALGALALATLGGAVTFGAVALVGAQSASGSAVGGATVQQGSAAAVPVTMAQIWADTGDATHHTVCASFLASPEGTWQSIAPALSTAGITHDDAVAFLASTCPVEASAADVIG